MDSRFVVSIGLATVLMSSSATAAAVSVLRPGDCVASAALARQHARAPQAAAELTDRNTGARMRAERLLTGGVQLDVAAGDVKLRKMLMPNGDFEVALRAGRDELLLNRRGSQLLVSRGGRSIPLDMLAPALEDLRQIQELIAGSEAVRQLRALRGTLSAQTLRHHSGVGLVIVDALVSVLKGEQPQQPPPTAGTTTQSAMAAVAVDGEPGGPTCYEAWQAEVVAAWTDYVACVYSFAWYNPLREVCAFAWVLRAESAWFQFLGCSSIPIKKDVQDAECLELAR